MIGERGGVAALTASPPDAVLCSDGMSPLAGTQVGSWSARAMPYLRIARIDHWSKNAFMAVGVMLAFFYRPDLATSAHVVPIALAIVATCLVASSNYVLNEVLDARQDALHPDKRHRPVPAGEVWLPAAYAEWLVLGACGLSVGLTVGASFTWALLALWIMGVLYNVPPVRLKDWPYVDVLGESINNPLRLFLGWLAVFPHRFPPVSLSIAYWMLGAFLMAAKRLAELRHIGDRSVLAGCRRSFRHYTEDRLLVSMFFYACTCALLGGIFIVRYKLELIAFAPFGAGFMAYYVKVALQPDSAAQHPERLHREVGLMIYLVACLVLFVSLMFVHVPILYEWFNVEPAGLAPLWKLGGR
jgi:decaprenyl-phosphate phosphoribosyltransferase